ncbi:hypothetical protein ACFWMG_15475 [Streptomyces sp. NPDC127074]|uniref:hypothetical protein n=1 Tax=Streptomyces sp. NPDC127074 TaxID=3347130 RepID=UPI00364A76B9
MNAEQFNARYPVGTPVMAYPATRNDAPLITRTRTEAWTLGHGAAVVSVDGYAGGIRLTHVDPAPADTDTFELPLSRCNITAVDNWLDKAGVFAKGYWEAVDGKLTVTGLRIGSDYQDRIVAKFGDTIVRHADGTHTVRHIIEAGEAS